MALNQTLGPPSTWPYYPQSSCENQNHPGRGLGGCQGPFLIRELIDGIAYRAFQYGEDYLGITGFMVVSVVQPRGIKAACCLRSGCYKEQAEAQHVVEEGRRTSGHSFTGGPKDHTKHKDHAFWFQGPRQQGSLTPSQ